MPIQGNITLKNVAALTASPLNKASGIVDELYFAPISEFLAIQVPDSAETDINLRGKIKSAHTFNSPKGFVKIADVVHGTGKYAHKSKGDKGFAMVEANAEVQSLGMNPSLVGALNQLQFQPGIALVKKADGNVMQIGCATHPAYLSHDYDSNTNDSSSPQGIKVMVSATQPEVYTYDNTLAITVIS